MERIVECVPNFSEGRRLEVIESISNAIAGVETVCVLDRHVDPDHNRSVITFIASAAKIVEAAFVAVERASELIDMRTHSGEHPRLGATDVLPFVPIKGITLEECAGLAHQAGARIAGELGIPVFYYEKAAKRPDRVNLEDVRRGALELLREQISTNPARIPDQGPRETHQTAGAIAVGARPFLIAFNVVLKTNDITIARQIARSIRAQHGGLPFLKALGFQLHSRELVQVSMNLVNYQVTGLEAAYDAVASEAAKLGVEIDSAELVGLAPEDALDRHGTYFSKLTHYSDKILEHRIARCGLPFSM